jgi:hypothetical protein
MLRVVSSAQKQRHAMLISRLGQHTQGIDASR